MPQDLLFPPMPAWGRRPRDLTDEELNEALARPAFSPFMSGGDRRASNILMMEEQMKRDEGRAAEAMARRQLEKRQRDLAEATREELPSPVIGGALPSHPGINVFTGYLNRPSPSSAGYVPQPGEAFDPSDILPRNFTPPTAGGVLPNTLPADHRDVAAGALEDDPVAKAFAAMLTPRGVDLAAGPAGFGMPAIPGGLDPTTAAGLEGARAGGQYLADLFAQTQPGISPREQQLRSGPPGIAVMRGGRTTYAYPPSPGASGAWPEYAEPYDAGQADWRRQVAAKEEQRVAGLGGVEMMKPLLEAQSRAEAGKLQREMFEETKSPEGVRRMAAMKLAETMQGPADFQLKLQALGQAFAKPPAGTASAGGTPPGGGMPQPSPILGMARLAPEVVDLAKTQQYADPSTLVGFMAQTYGPDFVRQNWKTILPFLNTQYTPDVVQSSPRTDPFTKYLSYAMPTRLIPGTRGNVYTEQGRREATLAAETPLGEAWENITGATPSTRTQGAALLRAMLQNVGLPALPARQP